MVRIRVLLLVAVAVAFGLAASALDLEAAKGDGGQEETSAAQGQDRTVDDDDDDDEGDDDDRDEGVALERQPIAGLGAAKLRYVPGQLLVRFAAGTSSVEIRAAAARAGGRVERAITEIRIHVVQVPPARTRRALASLRSEPSVESVERDALVQGLDTVPNDVLWPTQWGLRLVGAPRAWDATRGTSATVIAVLDTGIDPNHPDLAGATVPGRDLVNNDSDAADDEGHGTSAAGVTAARTNNGEGQAGTCWSCSLMPVKVLNSTGTGSMSTVAAGIIWAVDHGAGVVNMSLGGPLSTSALASAVAYAAERDAVLIAAAGNSGLNIPFYPAAYKEVVSVAATSESDARYLWSNYGDWVRVAAPGCNAAPRLGGGYVEFCGTSSAAPIVAGIAGLALSLSPGASKSEIEQAIATNAVPTPHVAHFGRVTAPEAMSAVAPNALPPGPPPAPAASPTPPAPSAAPVPPATRAAPSNLKRPRLLGRALVGRRLRVAAGLWSPTPTRFAYQWRLCRRNGAGCRTIRGARGRSYRLRARDRGRRVRAVVIAVNASGSLGALTGASAVVRRPRAR